MKNRPHFLLVGNGPYSNRGCEAIVRGTMAILRREFGDIRATVASYARPDVIARQAATEVDAAITHVPLSFARWSVPWLGKQADRALGRNSMSHCRMLDPFVETAAAALEIGGDNYSLDYGRPTQFFDMDIHLMRKNLPVALWGASVGPFDADPEFAPSAHSHLKSLNGILVRESSSYEYLTGLGIRENVGRMSDPAFAMEPIEPAPYKLGGDLPEGTIGLNFSPLMAEYVTDGNTVKWLERCAEIAVAVGRAAGRDVLLIPHVTSPHDNDSLLLRQVAELARSKAARNVQCAADNLSASETKWLISKCAVIGACRTHATIAGFSTCTPTLSFGYSVKAIGINRDIFGSLDYCISPRELTPEVVAERVLYMLGLSDDIRAHLSARIPSIIDEAYGGGQLLRKMIERTRELAV